MTPEIEHLEPLFTARASATRAPDAPPTARAGAARLGSLIGMLLAVLLVFFAPEEREAVFRIATPFTRTVPVGEADEAPALQAMEQRIHHLQTQLDAHLPRGPYLVVSTSDNRFRLMNGNRLTREGLCSTGSYVHLQGTDDREWVFQTPRGAFRIQKKTENPIWIKPDWAFIEEGRPVPPPGSPERLQRGVLGDYSLSLGDGYLLHGTLYQRLLGLPVTHGCVRLGDDDLAAIYQALRIGSLVFIY